LTAMRDLDARGWLTGVTTFNFHPHLPHYALTTDDAKLIRVLARQPIDMSHPHPFTEAGDREFNTFLWMPPSGTRAGDIVLVDLTIFTTLFGRTESLDRFWSNIATALVGGSRRMPSAADTPLGTYGTPSRGKAGLTYSMSGA